MGGSGTLSGGAVWLRVGIYVAATILLTLVADLLLRPLLARLSQGDSPGPGLMFIPVLFSLPALGAAVLAWRLPRPVPLRSAVVPRPWFWCAVLFLAGAGFHLAFLLGASNVNGWSDSASVAGGAGAVWGTLLTALPVAAVQALIAMVLLWGVARRGMSAARAGAVVAVALALPGLLSTLIASARGGGFPGRAVDTAVGTAAAAWTAETIIRLAAWALFYSGLARLVDGRGPVARWGLSVLALLPLLATSAAWRPFLPAVAPDGSLWSAIASTVATMTLVLALGALAWVLSAAPASRASARAAAAGGPTAP